MTKKIFFKLTYKFQRRLIAVLFFPLLYLNEGNFKNSLRRLILRFQHSLPIEFAVNKGETVVQVGTPWPRTINRYSKAIGPQGKLVVFEANPLNFATLNEHITTSTITNTTVIHAAVCNETGSGELAISPHRGDHKINLPHIVMDNDLREGNEHMETISVPFVRIDDILHQHNIEHIDFLSVTVNGAEVEAIKGASKTLSRARKGSRVYAKGHAIDQEGDPINLLLIEELKSLGFIARITRGESSSSDDGVWKKRAGDVFGWKAG